MSPSIALRHQTLRAEVVSMCSARVRHIECSDGGVASATLKNEWQTNQAPGAQLLNTLHVSLSWPHGLTEYIAWHRNFLGRRESTPHVK